METKKLRNFKILKLLLFISVIIITTLITLKLFPIFASLGTSEGQKKFKMEITNQGFSGVIYLVGLQLLQILIPILPGEPIELLAGMCYGTWGGLLLIFIGSFLSSTIIFFAVKKFGKDFICTFLGNDSLQKFDNSKFLANPKKIELLIFIAFFIPGTPKDFFTYIAGLLPINSIRFLLIATFARFPSIITSPFAGDNLVSGNLHITIITYVLTLVISGICLIIYNKHNKEQKRHN